MNTLLLIYCIVLSFSGFVIAFYGILAESQIDKITDDGIKKGINLNTEEGAKFYARKYEK